MIGLASIARKSDFHWLLLLCLTNENVQFFKTSRPIHVLNVHVNYLVSDHVIVECPIKVKHFRSHDVK